MTGKDSLNLLIEFSGGAELLFNKIKKHNVSLPKTEIPWTIKKLLMWIKDNLLAEKPEMFIQDDSVRPGILVLVNDSDWELLTRFHSSCVYNNVKLLVYNTFRITDKNGSESMVSITVVPSNINFFLPKFVIGLSTNINSF